MIITILLLTFLAAGGVYIAELNKKLTKQNEALKRELDIKDKRYEELADAYRDALNTIKELKAEVDQEPEYC